MVLPKEFYLEEDVVSIARQLLGKILITYIDKKLTAGIITETEAYAGIRDKASHAYNGRRTKRTEVMYAEGGVSYVYLCYGMHPLFNVVTNKKDIPDAVLIRAITPLEGIDTMLKRRKRHTLDLTDFSGPAKVTQAMGIELRHNNAILYKKDVIWIEEKSSITLHDEDIRATPRIGVEYAKEDALLPYRFVLSQHPGYNKIKSKK